jgi:hypothetical protein
MGATVQVRDLDPGVRSQLAAAAEREGLSLSALLRRELTRVAAQLELQGRIDGLGPRNGLGVPVGFLGISQEEVVASIREDRGE